MAIYDQDISPSQALKFLVLASLQLEEGSQALEEFSLLAVESEHAPELEAWAV